MRRLNAALLLLAACASPGMPPGGPPDVAAPEILGIAPDSGRTGVRPREVVFRFNEVVAEKPPSVTDLADLFLISPRDGTPRVSWNRDEIAVKPRRDWRPNTVYTVTMLRGLSDIRGNVRNTGASTFFSTGPSVPGTRITGRLFDWASGSVAPGAFVESFVPPDSVNAYVAIADSSGNFAFEHLPPGHYTVRGFIDRNKNRGIDPGELWDTVSVTLADSSRVELLAFSRDTIAPRVRDVVHADSMALRLAFDRPVDPTQQLSPANFAITGPDSLAVLIVSVSAASGDSSAAVARRAAGPAPLPVRSPVAARQDTVTRVRPVMSKPRPIGEVVIRLARQLTPGATYRVRSIGLRGLTGISGDSDRSYTAPPTAPPAQADSAPRPASPAPARPR